MGRLLFSIFMCIFCLIAAILNLKIGGINYISIMVIGCTLYWAGSIGYCLKAFEISKSNK